MNRVVWAIVAALALVVLAMAYVRLAPVEPARWHTDPSADVQAGRAGHYHVCTGGDRPALAGGADRLERLAEIAEATSRTRRIAGSVAEGRITWITRSAIWGFPDFTTAGIVETPEGLGICIHARLRFGRDDLGVNRARVEGWLAALDA